MALWHTHITTTEWHYGPLTSQEPSGTTAHSQPNKYHNKSVALRPTRVTATGWHYVPLTSQLSDPAAHSQQSCPAACQHFCPLRPRLPARHERYLRFPRHIHVRFPRPRALLPIPRQALDRGDHARLLVGDTAALSPRPDRRLRGRLVSRLSHHRGRPKSDPPWV